MDLKNAYLKKKFYWYNLQVCCYPWGHRVRHSLATELQISPVKSVQLMGFSIFTELQNLECYHHSQKKLHIY